MIRFAEVFPDESIVNALRTQLSWTRIRELLPVVDPLKRAFYAECAASNGGSPVRSSAGSGEASTTPRRAFSGIMELLSHPVLGPTPPRKGWGLTIGGSPDLHHH